MLGTKLSEHKLFRDMCEQYGVIRELPTYCRAGGSKQRLFIMSQPVLITRLGTALSGPLIQASRKETTKFKARFKVSSEAQVRKDSLQDSIPGDYQSETALNMPCVTPQNVHLPHQRVKTKRAVENQLARGELQSQSS